MKHPWLVSSLCAIVTVCGLIAGPAALAAAPPPVLGNQTVSAITVATRSGTFQHPLDSTPDLSGTTIYFTAGGPHGPGIFRAPFAGGAATEVSTGSPFVQPRGIAMSQDGQKIFVTDAAAGQGGAIFFVPLTPGSQPVLLPGSAGTAPEDLDVVSQGGKRMVYFSGKDPGTGQPAVLALPVAGAKTPRVVAEGAPLVTPDGVAVTHTGVVYVADRAAAGSGMGKIFKIVNHRVTPILNLVRTGNPAGIALTRDDSVLLVSALQLHRQRDQVLLVDLASLHTGSVTKVVSQNHSAGGVHAQPEGLGALAEHIVRPQLFSWADTTAHPDPPIIIKFGAVYAVTVG
jgi:DNA-binding beta-propeller fold protein YncE